MTAGHSQDAAVAEWSRLHGGYDVARSRLVRGWLALVLTLARPLVRAGVSPFVVTAAGVAAAAATCPLATDGAGGRAAAAVLAAASALLDGLDGAVAVSARRATRTGFVVDSMADRVADGLLLTALWLAGAPAGLAVAAGAGVALLEYLRARAGAAGMTDIGVVTVGERPTRVALAVVALAVSAGAGIYARSAVAAAAAATLAVSVLGLAQFARAARRALTP